MSVLVALGVGACGDNDLGANDNKIAGDAGTNLRRDSAPVEPAEGGEPLDAGAAPSPSCEKYCDLVTLHCVEANAQYDSKTECLSFCDHLPLEQPSRGGEEKSSASIGCRQYWADGPAGTSPESYCLAAGPFGGSACGDRCTAFCDVVLSVCPSSAVGDAAPYADPPSCASACASFSYRDAGSDGGGEGPVDGGGPVHGDSLNCRLARLRLAVTHPEQCKNLRVESEACKN